MRLAVSGIALLLVAACSAPQQSSNDDVLVAGANAYRYTGAAVPQDQTVTYQATCPQGSVLVQTPSGKTSCSHSSTSNLAVGDRNALSSDTFAELQEQVNRTGQPAAYTDGDVTIVLRPAP